MNPPTITGTPQVGQTLDSTSTDAVAAAGIPVNTVAPAISGTAQVGQTLTASTGEWTNNPTSYAYQWWNYTTNMEIAGATHSTHLINAPGIAGSQLTCHVTATNSSGTSAAAVSAPTAKIIAAGAVPVNTVLPAISGTPQVGQTLTATSGTWTNSPTSFTYQWNRAGTPIGKATASTYVPVSADVGNTLTISVTATNDSGSSTPATSAATRAVTAAGACPYSDSGWADGCAKAPAGAPQYPSLLNSYGRHRPPWNVAGVDYHVGVPAGAALTDWRTLKGAGITVDVAGGVITVTGDYDFENIDFSLGTGAVISNVAAANKVTINKCNFQLQPSHKNLDNIYLVNGGPYTDTTIIITNCNIDGTNLGAVPAFLSMPHNVTLQYNYFSHSKGQILQWTSKLGRCSPT